MSGFLTAIAPGALGTLVAIAASLAAILVLFVGFCVVFNLPKLRASGRGSMTVRSLDEMSGAAQVYLPSSTPHGPIDQLRTPELLENLARKSA